MKKRIQAWADVDAGVIRHLERTKKDAERWTIAPVHLVEREPAAERETRAKGKR